MIVGVAAAARADEHPLPAEVREKLSAEWKQLEERLTGRIDEMPEDVRLYSQRGDVRFFLGNFPGAVEDYSRMVELDRRQDASHWRRGIALFYAGRHAEAAAQFERYHAFDDVDRENGIWRYLSQYRATGAEAARRELLRYEKDDREPFPDVYRLFGGQIEPREILTRIETAEVGPAEKQKRLFYAHLYIGLNELVEGRRDTARVSLREAVGNDWPRTAGYGPHYMWQVGRLQYDLLTK